jgi:hypothetical protein
MWRFKLAFLCLLFSFYSFADRSLLSTCITQNVIDVFLSNSTCTSGNGFCSVESDDTCPPPRAYVYYYTNGECPPGMGMTQINGNTPFCSSLNCEGLASALANSYGVGGSCYETDLNDPNAQPCGPNGSTVCYGTDFSDTKPIPDGFNPTGSNGSNTVPDPNSMPQPTTPVVKEDTTKETTTIGNETSTTKTTTINNVDNSVTTITEETTINNETGDTTTTTITSTYNPATGQTQTSVSGSTAEGVEPDKEGNTASGGGGCDIAPACSGDAIQCLMLYQQWETRCAIESLADQKNGTLIGGDDCSVIPVKDDDITDFEFQTVMQNYRLRCPLTELLASDSNATFDSTAADNLETAKQEYRDFMTQIKNDISSTLSVSVSGSGSISDNIQTIKGASVNFSFSKWSSELSIIGTILVALCYISAAFMIFGASTRR